jgi:hypothetical protein
MQYCHYSVCFLGFGSGGSLAAAVLLEAGVVHRRILVHVVSTLDIEAGCAALYTVDNVAFFEQKFLVI